MKRVQAKIQQLNGMDPDVKFDLAKVINLPLVKKQTDATDEEGRK